jgi:hypothetical protein
MAILQAILAWIGRSLGSLLNTLFGWAVLALFGRTYGKQHVLLVTLTALAALWPVLLLGIPFPKLAAALFAFLSIPNDIRDVLRALWTVLAITVPLLVGVTLTRMSPVRVPWAQWPARVLIGFPATAALACGFGVVFFTVPVLRLISIWRKQEDLHVPLVAEPERYEAVSERVDHVIESYGIPVSRAHPPAWLTLPFHAMATIGHKALPGLLRNPSYWKGAGLEIALYPHDILIRGQRRRVAWTRGALVEGLACGPGLQTVTPAAQELERRLQALWEDPAGPEAGARRRVDPHEGLIQLVRDLRTQAIETEDWQVLYRKAEQFRRILEGEPALLESVQQEKPATRVPRQAGGSS